MTTGTKLLFELSGEHPVLPYAELEAVISAYAKKDNFKDFKISTYQATDRLAIIEVSEFSNSLIVKLSNRLAMCHSINELLASGSPKDIESTLEKLDNLGTGQNPTFKLFTKKLRKDDIWSKEEINALKNKIIRGFSKFALVEINHPELEIVLFRAPELFLARKIRDISRSEFEKRKPQNRPYFAPVSLHPRLARCLVNLAGLDDNQAVLDPFCGTGGLLLEAGLMGIPIIGSDVDPQMVAGTKKNLEHWNIKDFKLLTSNIEHLPQKLPKAASDEHLQAIVTEPPYGRASTTQGQKLDDLLNSSFKVFSELLPTTGRVVISLPEPELAQGIHHDFKLLNKFTFRVHKSLTKTIFVFEQKDIVEK